MTVWDGGKQRGLTHTCTSQLRNPLEWHFWLGLCFGSSRGWWAIQSDFWVFPSSHTHSLDSHGKLIHVHEQQNKHVNSQTAVSYAHQLPYLPNKGVNEFSLSSASTLQKNVQGSACGLCSQIFSREAGRNCGSSCPQHKNHTLQSLCCVHGVH